MGATQELGICAVAAGFLGGDASLHPITLSGCSHCWPASRGVGSGRCAPTPASDTPRYTRVWAPTAILVLETSDWPAAGISRASLPHVPGQRPGPEGCPRLPTDPGRESESSNSAFPAATEVALAVAWLETWSLQDMAVAVLSQASTGHIVVAIVMTPPAPTVVSL